MIKKVADAYTTLHANITAGNLGRPGSKRRARAEGKPIRFRADAAQPFDQRNLSIAPDVGTVSIWTSRGRCKNIAFACSAETRRTLTEHPRGETDLLYRDGKWMLLVTAEVPEPPMNTDPGGFVGVDLGIANIATTSGGYRAAGRGLNRHRARQGALRRQLQSKRTKSAKRVLKRRRRKERRRGTDINHCVSKRIVAEVNAPGTGSPWKS